MKEIKQAFEKITPHKMEDIQKELQTRDENLVVNVPRRKHYLRYAIPLIALSCALLFVFLPTFQQVETVVGLDVNPSIELNLDKDNTIIEVKTNNEDGKNIVGEMNLTGSDIEVGVNALIGAMLKEGYIDELKNSLLVSVTGGDEKQNEKLRQELSLNIEELLKASHINGSIVSQTIDDTNIETLAKQYNISIGKAEIIQQLVQKNSLYTFDSLKDLSIHELNLLLQSNQVDQVTITGDASESGYIGKEKAQSIALKDAGVTDPTVQKVEMDYDDGIMVYEVEFYKNNVEYDYEVNAKTGDIVKKEKETHQTSNSSATSSSSSSSQQTISKQEALNAAKKHAGVQSLSQEKIKQDYDDGMLTYEIEFVSGTYLYDYEIQASNGSVLKYEKEYVGKVNISADEAKQKAFSHAKVSSSQAYDVDVELKQQYYEVSFQAGAYEYEYKINSQDGSILAHEKEYD